MQKIIYCQANPENGRTDFHEVNDYLDKDWKIVSVTSQHTAVSTSTYSQRSYGGAFVLIESVIRL
jgi:hypothetical protein